MQGNNSLRERAISESEVLAWLRADYRLRSAFDPEVDSGVELTAQTTIADWRNACDLISARRLAKAMNEWFGCRRPVEEWQAVLEPEHTRTLGDLARFAAPHMCLADFTPFGIAGARDTASGAFFALRGLVAQAGQSIPDLRPSTVIASLSEPQVIALGFAVAKLAPELTPEPVVIPKRRQRISVLIGFVGFVTLIGGIAWTWPRIAWGGSIALLGGVLMARGRPERIEFGEFTTIAELVKSIVDRRQDAA